MRWAPPAASDRGDLMGSSGPRGVGTIGRKRPQSARRLLVGEWPLCCPGESRRRAAFAVIEVLRQTAATFVRVEKCPEASAGAAIIVRIVAVSRITLTPYDRLGSYRTPGRQALVDRSPPS